MPGGPRIVAALNNVPPIKLAEELGCSPTLAAIFNQQDDPSKVYFDPLNLATDINFSRLREAELKHGRVAMLSVLATLISWDGRAQVLEAKSPPLLSLLQEYTPTAYLKFIIACGVLETFVLVQVNAQDMPGDYGVGYFGVRDKGQNERSLESELENGRLAMLVMLFYLFQDLQLNASLYQRAWDFVLHQTSK